MFRYCASLQYHPQGAQCARFKTNCQRDAIIYKVVGRAVA